MRKSSYPLEPSDVTLVTLSLQRECIKALVSLLPIYGFRSIVRHCFLCLLKLTISCTYIIKLFGACYNFDLERAHNGNDVFVCVAV